MSALLVLLLSLTAYAQEDRCPALAGEYVAQACPKPDTLFSTTVVHQVQCRAIGFQKVNYKADGTPLSWGAVAWEPVGLGMLLRSENDKVANYVNRFYDADSLYAYSVDQDKATKEYTYRGSEIIDLLPNGNLFVSYPSSGMAQSMIDLRNCR